MGKIINKQAIKQSKMRHSLQLPPIQLNEVREVLNPYEEESPDRISRRRSSMKLKLSARKILMSDQLEDQVNISSYEVQNYQPYNSLKPLPVSRGSHRSLGRRLQPQKTRLLRDIFQEKFAASKQPKSDESR